MLEITDAFDVLDWPVQAIHDKLGNRGDELKKPKIALGAVKPIKPHFDIRAASSRFPSREFECVSEGGFGKLDLVEMCLGR